MDGPSSTLATLALAAGILGIVAVFFSWIPCIGGLFLVLNVLAGPTAALMGFLEVRNIDARTSPLAGRANAKLGMLLGIVATWLVFFRIGLCLFCAFGPAGLSLAGDVLKGLGQ